MSAATADDNEPDRSRRFYDRARKRTYVLGGNEGLRRAFLAVAHSLFARHGYDAVTMQQIAGALDRSKPTLYRFFEGKEHILRELLAGSKDDCTAAAVYGVHQVPARADDAAEARP